MSIALRKPQEIEKLKVANVVVAKTLKYLEENVKAGMTLKEVDAMGEKFIRNLGARPSFKGLYGFPNAVCTSLNEVIIHGIPSDTVLKDGDILGSSFNASRNQGVPRSQAQGARRAVRPDWLHHQRNRGSARS